MAIRSGPYRCLAATVAWFLTTVLLAGCGETPPKEEVAYPSPPTPKTVPLSDDEGDRLILQAMGRWTEAVKQYSGDPADSSGAKERRAEAEVGEAIALASAPHRELLDELAGYFPDKPRDIYFDIFSTKKSLRDEGIRADTSEILRGAAFLLRNSTNPGSNTRPIRAFDSQYATCREQGLSHDEAIKSMHERRKF
jgi:hypothetical protein